MSIGSYINAAGKLMTKVKSPKGMFVLGTACLVGAVVTAFKAGKEIDEVVEFNKDQIENTKVLREAGEYEAEDGELVEYTESDYKKDLTHNYIWFGVDVAKKMLPPIGLGVASFLCYKGGFNALGEKLATMTAAYTVLDRSYNKLLENAKEVYGEEAADKLKYGMIEPLEVDIPADIDPETGKKIGKAHKEKFDAVRDVGLSDNASPYAVRVQDCAGFTRDPNYNVIYLEHVQDLANAKLQTRGYLTLYEVYEALGLIGVVNASVEKMSHQCGWVLGHGDDHVTFKLLLAPVAAGIGSDGATKIYDQIALVDFNCIGNIWQYIG